jgi:predicted DNA-binding transcriptional regulator AlpA
MADRIYWRSELPSLFGRSDETIRRWIKDGTLPPPDVALSLQSRGWSLSTLHAHGIKITPEAANQPMPEASAA